MIGPGIGLDAAAIAFNGSVLVVKSDPITFPVPDAARYLVNVNANDIACMGAIPRWLLVTSLLPEKSTTVGLVEQQFNSLSTACRELDISLVGGHSEITLGLDRPILCGTLLGETTRDGLLDLRSARPGDAIVLANGIAIEGTAILASEAPPAAVARIDPDVLQRARNLSTAPGISVVGAARTLIDSGLALRGMHDPTEGGLASALDELALATGYGVRIESGGIDVLPETRAICGALNLDPLGVIASGALLAVVSPNDAGAAVAELARSGYRAAIIGELTERPDERALITSGGVRPLPEFETDELARFFAAVE